MPGIARRRRQPGSWSAARRSTRPRGDLARRARRSASARCGREVERCSRAGAAPAIDRRRRRVAQPGARAAAAERGDQPPLDRHRALELDQLLGDRGQQRLQRLRRRGARAAAGAARTARPISGSSRKRSWNGRRSSSTPVAKRMPLDAPSAPPPRRGAGARTARGRARAGPRATSTGSPSTCSSRWSAGAAAAQQAVRRAAAEPERPRRPHLDADLGTPSGSLRSTASRAQGPRDLPRPHPPLNPRASRWTSTRNEFEVTISPSTPLLAAPPARGARPRRRRTTADRRRAGDEPGGRQRGGLPRGHRRRRRRGSSTAAARPTTGRPSTTSPSSCRRTWLTGSMHDCHSMTIASDAAHRVRALRRRAEDDVPVGRADRRSPRSSSWKWWRMCSSRSRRPSRVRGMWWCTR